MMSMRGSRPKIASDKLAEPASAPSSVVIFNSISRTLLLSRRGGSFRRRRRSRIGRAELARLRRVLVQRLLHRIAHRDPAALGTRHRAFDQDEAALDIELNDLEVERGDTLDAHVARHLLVLEGLARILTAASRTDRAVRNGDAVRGAQAAEVPALHATGETFTDGDAANIDELTRDKVVGGDLGPYRDQRVLPHAEFGKLALRLDVRLAEIAAVGFVP